MPDMTPPVGQDDADTNDNWQQRYQGLQRVVSTRDRDLAAMASERDALKTQLDADVADRAEFEEYRKANEASRAEQSERETFEALRAKFEEPEEDPPMPMSHNEARVWTEPYERKADEAREGGGYPI